MIKILTNHRMIAGAAFVLLTAMVPSAGALDLRTYAVGTWRQPMKSVIGTTDIYETTYRADGTFIQYIYVNGNRNYSPAWVSGRWEVRQGNQVWMHNLGWFPVYNRSNATRVQVEEWTSTAVQIVDANHARNRAGVATRIG